MAARLSRERIVKELRLAARKGDRTALQVALDALKTLAYSPRYWDRYLALLSYPLARLADLLVIKQGERIARQRGVVIGSRKGKRKGAGKKPAAAPPRRSRPRRRRPSPSQPSLFPELD